MTEPYQINWKKYIDPDFDLSVKAYLQIIRDVVKDNDANSGYFAFKDEYLKTILDSAGWQDLYDGKESERVVKEMFGKDEIIPDLNSTSLGKNNKLNLEEELVKFFPINLSEQSKLFYISKFKLYTDGSFQKKIRRLHGREKVNATRRFFRSVLSIYLSISVRHMINDLEEHDDDIKIYKKPSMLNSLIAGLLTTHSEMVYRQGIHDLLAQRRDNQILKAVTVDKTIICSDAMKRRIMRAQLEGDDNFFKHLGRAIAQKPRGKEKQDYETYIILKQFWTTGLFNLSTQDLFYFLKSCGINPPDYPDALDQFVKRHIRPIYKNWPPLKKKKNVVKDKK